MLPHRLQTDDVLDQVIEDERAAALQEFREREEFSISKRAASADN